MSYQLRPEYQLPAHEKTIEWCRNSHEPAYHSMSVGAGKTINIAFAAKNTVDKGGRVLILARQGELIEQNADDYKMIGGKCSIFSASLGMKSTYFPAAFATEGTVSRSLDINFTKDKYDLLLIDECHMVDWEDCLLEFPESQYGKIIKHLRMVNPKIRIIGYTGSPYRKNALIKGEFWKEQLSDVSTYQLINLGYLVPPVFGFGDDDHHYAGLDKFQTSDNEQSDDFTSKEMAAMAREICKQKKITQIIIEEVIERTADRLGVLITCASKKHCEQVAEFLPPDSFGIVTDSTSTKVRKKILDDAKSGAIKYVLQIGCLSTGVNVPRWDVIVILRKIRSLTYLIQLSGRGLRTLKPEQLENGLQKHDCLILDYTDTFECMGKIFDDPIIQDAIVSKKSKEPELQECPECGCINSEFAVRCRGEDENVEDGRCEYFFQSRVCLKCGTDNAPSARNCRKCDAILIDPTKDLVNKAYTDDDYKPVLGMHLGETMGGNLSVTYELASKIHINGIEHNEVAKEFFLPTSKERFHKAKWWKFVSDHIQGDSSRRIFSYCKTISDIIDKQKMLDIPEFITHRVNDKGFSIINRKRFRSGREESKG